MKKTILFIFISLCCISVFSEVRGNGTGAGSNIVLKPKNNPHTEVNIPADMPDVFYNSEAGTITIVDYAHANLN